MTNLHGLLAELGLAAPEMHPEREASLESDWIVDQPFVPEQGQCYEIAYGMLMLHGSETYARVRIRVDGSSPSQWFDLDQGQNIDQELQLRPVRAYRRIAASCSSSTH